jgi:hypothetical protein
VHSPFPSKVPYTFKIALSKYFVIQLIKQIVRLTCMVFIWRQSETAFVTASRYENGSEKSEHFLEDLVFWSNECPVQYRPLLPPNTYGSGTNIVLGSKKQNLFLVHRLLLLHFFNPIPESIPLNDFHLGFFFVYCRLLLRLIIFYV